MWSKVLTLKPLCLVVGVVILYPAAECSNLLRKAEAHPGSPRRPLASNGGTVDLHIREKSRKSSTLLEPIIIHHKSAKDKSDENSVLPCSGTCMTEKSCVNQGGLLRGGCSSGEVCCNFQGTCGGRSREPVSFFKSPRYPTLLNDSLDCIFEVHTNEDTCALRVDFLSFKVKRAVHSSKVDKCVVDALYVLNTEYGYNEPVCEMENHTAIVRVKNGSPSTIKFIMIAQSEQVNWNIKISQVNCRKLQPWRNEPGCGRQVMYDDANNNETDSSYDDEQQLTIHPFIVNGQNANCKEFPWQISLQSKSKKSHRCGGSIINKRFILTAAHCIMRNGFEPKSKLKVLIGGCTLNKTNDDDEPEFQEFEIESIISHFHYKPHSSHINDIAVIKVAGEIAFSENAQPVCLPPSNFSAVGMTGWVSGFGRLNGTDPTAIASIMQKLNVSIIDDLLCRELVQEEVQNILHRNITFEDMQSIAQLGQRASQLCARPPLNSAICFGDSGGPLVVQREEDGSYMQVGVVSYGLGKCITQRNPPAAYTKVTEFLDFIAIATLDS